MIEFKMPSLGADMESATLVEWQKRPGDPVHRGDLIAEVETDKGVIEIEAFNDGVIEKVLVPAGEKVAVGTVLALINEAPGADGSPASLSLSTPAPARVLEELIRLPISPSARRLARELGVDPHTVKGTGHGGAITREDIQRAAKNTGMAAVTEQPPSSAKTSIDAAERARRMRQVIGAAMARSKREIPHYYLSTTIDLQPAMDWLAEQNQVRRITDRLLYGVLLLKATALALREVPELNCVWEGDRPIVRKAIHVGVAISVRQGGLVAPAIHDTDQKSINDLMPAFHDLVNRARSGGLRASELSDATITVTSLGDTSVETVFGVIYPPQTAIVGFGAPVERPWSMHGGLMSRQVITASLSADHRVTDGHRGGLFLKALSRLLQEPEKL